MSTHHTYRACRCFSSAHVYVDPQLSQNVAGVTLLALGNGAPDLFSAFSATNSGSPDLAVGGAVGSGLFITTVCVGGVAFLAPFKVTRRPFLRDVAFYVVALVRARRRRQL